MKSLLRTLLSRSIQPKTFVMSFFCAVLTVCTSLAAEPKLPTYYPQEEHVATYLNQMPWQYYQSYYVNGLGWFWVDNARDVVKDTIKRGQVWEPQIL